MNLSNPQTVSEQALVPEILAPVGGREQFFAALNSGADAVFLGLKNFNARARAENFSLDDLRELVPLAHAHGMRVLVTMNILIKNSELKPLLETLSALEEIAVDAIIVQDLGLARLCKTYFPNLRMHASTQMAVHNLDGVREAMAAGFKRVVLARELTALEIKKIRSAFSREEVEIEAFCHGSLCYSYSGLCFFSGAEDARSGNRGECAYTCRKPYKIVNEPGHGFLFSMKDLNTVESLHLLVEAGVDTLKIEGRKKDAQYVSMVVQTYRQKLDELFGRPTLRRDAPALAHVLAQEKSHTPEKLKEQLSLTFQRDSTSFFLKGRYHENVIDLNNPTHKGQPVGDVLNVRGRCIEIRSECDLERFDGLRIDQAESLYHSKPQHGSTLSKGTEGVKDKYQNRVCQFSLRSMRCEGKLVPTAQRGMVLEIDIPDDLPMPNVGDRVVRTRSDALRRDIEKVSKPSSETRLRPLKACELVLNTRVEGDTLVMNLVAQKFAKTILQVSHRTPALRPKSGTSTFTSDIRDGLTVLGNIGFTTTQFQFEGDMNWFVPRGQIKELKRSLEAELANAYESFLKERLAAALEAVNHALVPIQQNSQQESSLAVKIDRIEYLEWLRESLEHNGSSKNLKINELVFEPKRAFLPSLSFEAVVAQLKSFQQSTGIAVRLAFPTVLRAWDEPLMKRWLQEFLAQGITDIELGNVGVLAMLERWGVREQVTSLASDFTLYSLNSASAAHWQTRGLSKVALSVEDDLKNISDTSLRWPAGLTPQVILFKDTPLFIAESCSLTALHNGCPTSAVCGYRTLEIENDAGDRFFVAHESCKSIVYDKKAYSIVHRRSALEGLGFRNFRIDFLTRPYSKEDFLHVLSSVFTQSTIAGTHTANFERTLL